MTALDLFCGPNSNPDERFCSSRLAVHSPAQRQSGKAGGRLIAVKPRGQIE